MLSIRYSMTYQTEFVLKIATSISLGALLISGCNDIDRAISSSDEKLAEKVVLQVRQRCLDDAHRYVPSGCSDCEPTKAQIQERLTLMDACFEDWLNRKWNLVQNSRNAQ
jgi:hypothetical protein